MYRPSPRLILVGLLLALVLVLAGCVAPSTNNAQQAYIAPATVNLRRELAQKNSTVAVLKHGERVSVIDARRRFMKIRTAKGIEGWIDSADLLTPEQMEQIKQEREHALAMPSEGVATVYEALNIHIDPSRSSPAFAKIPEGGSVQVLALKLEPKVTGPVRPSFVFHKPEPISRKHKKQSKAGFHIAPPPPPKPPSNWQKQSEDEAKAAESEKKTETPAKPIVMEDWTLVRTKNNECGWVLSRNLTMSIPDEVAQYAEGKRITSYFDLGTVVDEEKGTKHNWLWTTLSHSEPYDFDGWRVFLWNRRHHRYETSYRERDVEGYFPVHVDTPESNSLDRSFELIMRDEDAKLLIHRYTFDGVRVHSAGVEEYRPSEASAAAGQTAGTGTQGHSKHGWLWQEWSKWKRRLGGK